MILTCPQCQTRFVVPSGAIPEEGRKVRCAQCKHEWHQKPIEDEEADIVAEEENKAVVDETQQSASPKKEEGKTAIGDGKLSLIKQDIIDGIKPFSAGLGFVLICFFIYQWLTPYVIVGQGLVFENITIERDEHDLIVVGEIVNTMNEKRGVPSVLITLLHKDVEGDRSLFSAGQDFLDEGEALPVSFTLSNVPEGVTDLRVTFDLGEMKKDSTHDESDIHEKHHDDNKHNGEESHH